MTVSRSRRALAALLGCWLLTLLAACGGGRSSGSSVASFNVAVPASTFLPASADGSVIAFVNPQSTGWAAYSLRTGKRLGSAPDSGFDASCEVSVVRRGDGADVVLTADKVASGKSLTLVAANAESGARLWSTAMPAGACTNDLDNFTGAADGSAALYADGTENTLVNLTTGASKDLGSTSNSVTESDGEMIGSDVYVASDLTPGSVNVYQASTGRQLPSVTSATLANCVFADCPATNTASGYIYVAPANVNNDASGAAVAESGVSLSTAAHLWTTPVQILSTPGMDPAGPVDIARAGASDGYPTTAVSVQTGKIAWETHGGNDCGATSGKYVIQRNNEQIIMDAATGKTLSQSMTTCQHVYPGAILDAPADSNGRQFTVVPEPGASGS